MTHNKKINEKENREKIESRDIPWLLHNWFIKTDQIQFFNKKVVDNIKNNVSIGDSIWNMSSKAFID